MSPTAHGVPDHTRDFKQPAEDGWCGDPLDHASTFLHFADFDHSWANIELGGGICDYLASLQER
jgi:hypothetical protein